MATNPRAWAKWTSSWPAMRVNSSRAQALWRERLAYLGDRNIGIDAVEARVEFDRKNGFKVDSFTVSAFLGTPKRELLIPHDSDDVTIATLDCENEADVQRLLEYDTAKHTIRREGCFRQWIDPKVTTTLVARDVSGNVIGYGCLQPIEGGHVMIGPVFAERSEVGRELLVRLCLAAPSEKCVGFDVPQENIVSMQFAREHAMTEELRLVRMYTKEVVLGIDVRKVFAFTTMGTALA